MVICVAPDPALPQFPAGLRHRRSQRRDRCARSDGYGSLTITHGISIQGHGLGAITPSCTGCAAITISVTTSDPVTLNGLVLDGVGPGWAGIYITSGLSIQILNSVVRHFSYGIAYGSSANGSNLLIEDTVASDNTFGIPIGPTGTFANTTLNKITANNNNSYGVGVGTPDVHTTIANLVMSSNGTGLLEQVPA
jgi:hypothetical protein